MFVPCLDILEADDMFGVLQPSDKRHSTPGRKTEEEEKEEGGGGE